MLMEYRGIKASELIEKLQSLIEQYGDLEVYKDRNGNARPIYWADFIKNENRFELV